jgi:NADH-quinone oxidoreductase subunit H
MEYIAFLFTILIFPGLLFFVLMAFSAESIERILYAKMQNRKGPPWYQPLADFIKLSAKEIIIPRAADAKPFKFLPLVACAASACAFLYIPLWKNHSIFPFSGDIVAVVYMLTLPTMCFFLAGWYSRSLYSLVGAMRVLTQLFAYEVPLLMAVLSPAILAGSWTFTGVNAFYAANPLLALVNILGFAVALISVQGKLEKVPFDAPEAETEITAGPFTEYTGRLYGFWRLAGNMQTIAASSLVAAVFVPFGYNFAQPVSFLVYLAKILVIIFLVAVIRTIFARLRTEQIVNFCWRVLAPLALVQIAVNIIVKSYL